MGRTAVALCTLLPPPRAAPAQEIVAVPSSDLLAYREALAGFEERLGRPFSRIDIAAAESGRLPPHSRVVVAFGGKAAMLPIPEAAALVYCLAPGTLAGADVRTAGAVKVWMLPHPSVVLAQLAQIQPGLRRLAVFWASPGNEEYVRTTEGAARAAAIEIRSIRVEDAGAIPGALRAFAPSQGDAVWLLPDPLLVNASTFSLFREFSWSNSVPFYAPNQRLVEKGATASVSASFREIGRAAAGAALAAHAGASVPADVFPEKSETTINLSAAGRCRLQPTPAILARADKVWP